MKAFFAFLRGLLADPRSVRAVDETELDWRNESVEVTSLPGRVAVTLRTFLACLRVCVLSSVREVRYRHVREVQMNFPSYGAQSGSLPMVIVRGTATLIMAFTGITEPEHRNIALLIFTIGLGATWREYLNWSRTRHERLVR
jgi:hypothetical protein